MTSASYAPQVNYPAKDESEGAEQQQPGPSGMAMPKQAEQPQQQMHLCSVCGDESDGLHFGQFTCRACAAFFRRTVSLKLQYTCKRGGKCEVDKAARNTCRACRYAKCLQYGMQKSAVQHARDGIGKRAKSAQKMLLDSSGMPDIKVPKEAKGGDRRSATPAAVERSGGAIQHPHAQFMGSGVGFGAQQPVLQSPSLLEQTLYQLNVSGQFPPPSSANLVGQHLSQLLSASSSMFPSSSADPSALQPQLLPSTSSARAQPELKYLGRMLEGYHHFMSLRKSSYTLVEGFPLNKRDDEDCPQSNFGTSKKICKIEASLIMDTVERFFMPFNQLPVEDKHKMFDPFYCLFSNAERAFRTYKMFGPGDDRLLMPDGGYIRLSELHKFYENNTLVRGDPGQVARIFENAMHYLVKTVVTHMRNIELEEMELIALFGMFIWNDSEEISSQSLQMAQRMRNEIILDLHLFYRSQGLSEAEITLKTANLFLLIPKLENAVRLLCENFQVANVFNMINVVCCPSGMKNKEMGLLKKCC